jgi:hypothetical protein
MTAMTAATRRNFSKVGDRNRRSCRFSILP